MTLYLKVDTPVWYKGDYTDVGGLSITGTIYSNATMVTAFDYTGYTLKIKGFNQRGEEEFSFDAAAVTEASGTWIFSPAIGNLNIDFIGDIVIELTKTDSRLQARGRNSSAGFWITDK